MLGNIGKQHQEKGAQGKRSTGEEEHRGRGAQGKRSTGEKKGRGAYYKIWTGKYICFFSMFLRNNLLLLVGPGGYSERSSGSSCGALKILITPKKS